MASAALPTPAADPVAAVTPPPKTVARAAGLRYVADDQPGIRRVRKGKGFAFVGPGGAAVRGVDELARIKALAIPPAWEDVWICPYADGHLQATGRDARGRKQYRYHPGWRKVRDETKYHRTIAFAEALPAIRERVARDLRRKGLPREKVVAAVVSLLERTLIRVGNEEYRKANGSHGLTTLRDHHVRFDGAAGLRFRFRGKGGKWHDVDLEDPRLARVVRACRDIPGQELFQYYDGEGERQPVSSTDVNAYLREATGQDFTAKDFRTWAGTVLCAGALRELEPGTAKTRRKRNVAKAIQAVAARLGNTPAVCRRAYVHPAVVESYVAGDLHEALARAADAADATGREADGLDDEERAVLALLRERLEEEQVGGAGGTTREPRALSARRRRST